MDKFKAKAIIFDMDGVITDTMPYHFMAWAEIFAKHGITVSVEDIYKREGQKGIESLKEIFAEYQMPFDSSVAVQSLKDKETLFKRIFHRKFIKGSRTFIHKSLNRGFRLALVTGTSRHEAQKLLPAKLWNMFEVIICGSDVQNGKPHPEPYLKALKQLKLPAKDVLVIENAPFGIRSARSAGLRCVAIATSLSKPYLLEANVVFNSFEDFVKKIELIKI